MRGIRIAVVSLAAVLVLGGTVAIALAAPAALSPARGAAAAEYCPPGVEEDRRQQARALVAEVRAAGRDVAKLRKAQASAKKAYFRRVRSASLRKAFVRGQQADAKAARADLAALRRDLRRARAAVARCD